jgi:uncharacterized protein (TIGR03435 family)
MPLILLSGIGFLASAGEFEVATLKQSPPPAGDSIDINLGTARNGKLTLANATLSECVRYAYSIVSDDLIGGPDWIKSRAVRFDIVAQAPPDTSQDQLRQMLQTLLAERLKLALHREQKPLAYLALVQGRNGPTPPGNDLPEQYTLGWKDSRQPDVHACFSHAAFAFRAPDRRGHDRAWRIV